MVLCTTERDLVDPNAYSRMTAGVGAPVDGLLARGGPGLTQQQLPAMNNFPSENIRQN